MKKLNICLVIRLLNNRSGGAERIYSELANLLASEGHIVSCVYYDPHKGAPYFPIQPGIERINLHPVVKDKPSIFRKIRSLTKPSYRREWSEENDFFIAQLQSFLAQRKIDIAISLLPPANTVTLVAARDLKTKVIACNHNVPKEDYESSTRWSQNPIDKKMRLDLLDSADAIHVLFPSFATWFPNHLHSKIYPIPNYISPDFDKTKDNKKEKLVIGVGRLTAIKNYEILIREWKPIASNFPDWRLEIYGIGPQYTRLESLIHDLELSGTVILKGHIKDLSDVYSRAALLCHPALFEGFGLSVAEALYCGTPILAYSDCAGVNEFVVDKKNGLMVERRSGSLSAALQAFIADGVLREALTANSISSVEAFTYAEYKRKWIELVQTVHRGNNIGKD